MEWRKVDVGGVSVCVKMMVCVCCCREDGHCRGGGVGPCGDGDEVEEEYGGGPGCCCTMGGTRRRRWWRWSWRGRVLEMSCKGEEDGRGGVVRALGDGAVGSKGMERLAVDLLEEEDDVGEDGGPWGFVEDLKGGGAARWGTRSRADGGSVG